VVSIKRMEMAIGIMVFHVILISMSYRIRGNEIRDQTKKTIIIEIMISWYILLDKLINKK